MGPFSSSEHTALYPGFWVPSHLQNTQHSTQISPGSLLIFRIHSTVPRFLGPFSSSEPQHSTQDSAGSLLILATSMESQYSPLFRTTGEQYNYGEPDHQQARNYYTFLASTTLCTLTPFLTLVKTKQKSPVPVVFVDLSLSTGGPSSYASCIS